MIIPTATLRLALSPPIIALALTASAYALPGWVCYKEYYLSIKYKLVGIVPSVGLALPTLIGSVFPTSHRRAIEVAARSSTNSSLNKGVVGSVASFYFDTAFCNCSEQNCCLDLFALIFSRTDCMTDISVSTLLIWSVLEWIIACANLVNYSPPANASWLAWVNIRSSDAWTSKFISDKDPYTPKAAGDLILIALELPPSSLILWLLISFLLFAVI